MSVLEKIVEEKRRFVAEKKISFPLESFRSGLCKSDRDFYSAMSSKKPAFILECKKASPSKGLIRADFDPVAIARVYKNYATAVSVLCDEPFFQGKLENLQLVRAELPQPVLAKDFIIDEYQIFLARHYGADAILLMLSVLSEEEYVPLAETAHSLGMGVLTEVSTPKEAEIAKRVKAKVVGINNRNLHDLTTDIARTREMANLVKQEGVVVVAESGIYEHAEILNTLEYADAFLIGTSLMREKDLESACRRLLLGENKVCGLTRVSDARAAFDLGAVYGGLIFAEKSPRKVSESCAKEIITTVPGLKYVGVFQNQDAEFISSLATKLGLFAVQLHGNESEEFAQSLRTKLPKGMQVWKAISGDSLCGEESELPREDVFERLVLDAGNGGSGRTFDWGKIPKSVRDRALLAGGISPENACSAHKITCRGLDINSGAETAPGQKSPELLSKIFEEIRKF